MEKLTKEQVREGLKKRKAAFVYLEDMAANSRFQDMKSYFESLLMENERFKPMLSGKMLVFENLLIRDLKVYPKP